MMHVSWMVNGHNGYPLPSWAERLASFVRRLEYKPWIRMGIVLDVHDLDFERDVVRYAASSAVFTYIAPSSTELADLMRGQQVVFDWANSEPVHIEAAVNMCKVGIRRLLPPWVFESDWTDEQMFDRRMFYWFREQIHWIEKHEADEALFLDGVALAYPHHPKQVPLT